MNKSEAHSSKLQENDTIGQEGSVHVNIAGEGEVGSDKCSDHRSREDKIESTTPCHDAQLGRLCYIQNPVRPSVLATKYTTALQHLQDKIRSSRKILECFTVLYLQSSVKIHLLHLQRLKIFFYSLKVLQQILHSTFQF